MKVLHVIHGFPPYYGAGSETYTYNLTSELAHYIDVGVFSRIENPFAKDYEIKDIQSSNVHLRFVNKPHNHTFRDTYIDEKIDEKFREMMKDFQPDIVHIGHLCHLSTNIPIIAWTEFKTPVIFTVHDFWMGCFRGQLVDYTGKICETPSQERCLLCARHYYKEWMLYKDIELYFSQMHQVFDSIKIFLSPSRTVQNFLIEKMHISPLKVIYSPYGFNHRIAQRTLPKGARAKEGHVRFGFIGRIIPVKGIALLMQAFQQVSGCAELHIFGDLADNKLFLEEFQKNDARIFFHGHFNNSEELKQVLDKIDVLVVPSLWLENAPLVINEALIAGVPVITSNKGGMAELIQDGVNGFLFPLGDQIALRDVMQKLVDHPDSILRLSINPQSIRTIEDDAKSCLIYYRQMLSPRRVTFVTNPGICNLSCIMCDTHSKFNTKRVEDCKRLPIMDFSIIEKTVRDLSPLGLEEIIPSTMGEPLLYPEFDKILHLAEKYHIKVNLTTNATFPRGGVDVWARKLLPVLSDIKCSLNALNPSLNESIMNGVKTERQIANIEQFLQLRDRYSSRTGKYCTVTIQMTFLRSNIDAIADVLLWAISHGIDRLKGHHLWVTWPEIQKESLQTPDDYSHWNKVVSHLHELVKTHLMPNGKHILLENFAFLPNIKDREHLGRCPFLGKEAWVEADGTFQICCCPSNERKKFGDFGRIGPHSSLQSLWMSERYQSFINLWGNYENCRKCTMRIPIVTTNQYDAKNSNNT